MKKWAEAQGVQNCCPRGRLWRGVQRLLVTENRWRAEHKGVNRPGLGLEPFCGLGLERAGGGQRGGGALDLPFVPQSCRKRGP